MKSSLHASTFMKNYSSLTDVLTDHKLAALGDAYINLVYSLALSAKMGEPAGKKVKGTVLAEALRKAGLRQYMPSRMTSHKLADAAEALLVYAWLNNCITLEQSVAILLESDDLINGLTQLLIKAKEAVKLS
jgi:hypothetical protein